MCFEKDIKSVIIKFEILTQIGTFLTFWGFTPDDIQYIFRQFSTFRSFICFHNSSAFSVIVALPETYDSCHLENSFPGQPRAHEWRKIPKYSHVI